MNQCIGGKIGGAFNLVALRCTFANHQIELANISYLHNNYIIIYMYVWRSLMELPNLNMPIFWQWRFGAQMPNLIPTNNSGFIAFILLVCSDLLRVWCCLCVYICKHNVYNVSPCCTLQVWPLIMSERHYMEYTGRRLVGCCSFQTPSSVKLRENITVMRNVK